MFSSDAGSGTKNKQHKRSVSKKDMNDMKHKVINQFYEL